MPKGTTLYCLKRGVRKADIFSLAFNQDSSFLGVTSDRGTLHLFALSKTFRRRRRDVRTAE
ncbi:MAG: hypothetical protein P4M11_15585 [Candidatus Pacebacteria bacterium]|nr:hypothetical protein [Candidatus Paceibacterota bacterium]